METSSIRKTRRTYTALSNSFREIFDAKDEGIGSFC